ncbi:MAG: hypothetical protein OXI15_02310 [Chromatiales bacterium]|nr:hypothetical protein [Chromatiales bacterium]
MFCMSPSRPTRPDDYEITRAGRPLSNTRITPAGLTPRRLAQAALEDPAPAYVHRVDARPWISGPAVLLTDVIAAPDPWTGALLDSRHPQPLPVGALLRQLDAPTPAGTSPWRLVWPDQALRPVTIPDDPRTVAAFIDEPAMAHFALALDAAGNILAGDERITAAAEAVTTWIADVLRTTPRTNRPAPAPVNASGPPPIPRAARIPRRTPPRPRTVTCRWC